MADVMIETTPAIESVNYHVVENPVASKSAGKPVYTGVVEVKETYNTSDVAKRMVAEGCPVKGSTVLLVLNEFADMLAKLTAEGRAVNINGLVRFAPAVRGTFASAEAPWNAASNALVVNASVGARLRNAASTSSVVRTDRILALPVLDRVVDLTTVTDGVISSEGAFFVMGSGLTWNPAAEDEGFFLDDGSGEARCEGIESVQNPTCAALRTDLVFESSGVALTLVFRTRQGGTTLRQVAFAKPLVTA